MRTNNFVINYKVFLIADYIKLFVRCERFNRKNIVLCEGSVFGFIFLFTLQKNN